jgi:hypothetical protein
MSSAGKIIVGFADGAAEGLAVGLLVVGLLDGVIVIVLLGVIVGFIDGAAEGLPVGLLVVGLLDGVIVIVLLGVIVDFIVGRFLNRTLLFPSSSKSVGIMLLREDAEESDGIIEVGKLLHVVVLDEGERDDEALDGETVGRKVNNGLEGEEDGALVETLDGFSVGGRDGEAKRDGERED